jgi:hypothetical protein
MVGHSSITWYSVGLWITWAVIFIATWIYCAAVYGWVWGFGFGWLPAAFVATVAAVMWPLVLAALSVYVALKAI